MQQRSLYSAWDGNPPNIQLLSILMPDAPYLPLTGGGTARMSLDAVLRDLDRDAQKQTGGFFEYVWESDREEADTYSLQSWEVCRPDSGIFEAIVVFYYFPIKSYLTLGKYMGQDTADEYPKDIAIDSLPSLLFNFSLKPLPSLHFSHLWVRHSLNKGC